MFEFCLFILSSFSGLLSDLFSAIQEKNKDEKNNSIRFPPFLFLLA